MNKTVISPLTLGVLEKVSEQAPLKKSLERLFKETLPPISNAFGAESAAAWLVAKDNERLYVFASYNIKAAFTRFFRKRENQPRLGDGIVGSVLAKRKAIVEHNVLNSKNVPEHWKAFIRSGGISFHTLLALPLLVEGKKVVGVLNLYFRDQRIFTKEELRALNIIAAQLGGKIENQTYYKNLQENKAELQEERGQLAGLQQATQFLSITAGKSLRVLLDELSQSVGKALETNAIAIWRPTSDGKHLKIFVQKGISERYLEGFAAHPLAIGMGNIVGRAAFTKKPIFLPNVSTLKLRGMRPEISDKLINLALEESVLSISSLPLLVRGKLFGVLNFYFPRPHRYSSGERHILESVGNMVAIAVGNTLYRDELKESQQALMNMLEDTEEARQGAEEERNKNQLIISNLTDGLLVFDEQGRLDFANTQAERMLGIETEELRGRHVVELQKVSALSSVAALLLRETTIVRKEAELPRERIAEVTRIELENKGNKQGEIIVLHDVSRDKEIDRLKTEFVSLAAHQLRTPLSAIKWTIQMLLEKDAGPLSKGQEELLGKTRASNERMIQLVDDLLNVARIEEGRYLYKPKFQHIEKLVGEVVELHKEQAKQKEVKLEYKKPKENFPHVLVDEEKIRLAVQSLLDNALRYTPKKGQVTVRVSHDTKEVRVSFTDTGIGIPEKQHSRVFEKFFRATNARIVDTEGSGLGLYLVQNIVKAHRGDIWFESKKGKGSTFILSLPIKEKSAEFLKKF